LLDMGAKENAVTADGRTALHLATERGHRKCIKLLCPLLSPQPHGDKLHRFDLQFLSRHDERTIALCTFLHCAALQGNDDMVAFLLDMGAKENAVTADGRTASREL
jgi:ankyrin repeat protein